jgi:phosphoglycolate phosphatase-like HAD superfamily hydrolase
MALFGLFFPLFYGKAEQGDIMSLENDHLFLDQDDTTIDSTPNIHWPGYVELVKKFRPERFENGDYFDLEGFYILNFRNELFNHYLDENHELRGIKGLGLTKEENSKGYDIWRSFTQTIVPPFFDGIIEALQEYQAKGGRIIIVSHSEPAIIEKRYAQDGRVLPDLIYGHVPGEKGKNKPHPFPVHETKRIYDKTMDLERAIVVDDLKPGIDMADAAGIKSAIAGWGKGQQIPEIRDYAKTLTDIYFNNVSEFRDFILQEK